MDRPAPSLVRQRLQTALSIVVVLAILAFARSMVDWGEVWEAVTAMTGLEVASLVVLAAWNILTYLFVMVAAMPGLSYRDAFVVGQASTAVAATLPAGSALGIGVTYGMYASYGHEGSTIALATVLTGVWNNFAKLGLPVVALVALAVTGEVSSAGTTAAVVGATALTVAVAVLALTLRSDRFAAGVGAVGQRAAGPAARILGRPAPRTWPDATVRFRHRTVDLLRRRWHVLTLATLVSHLSLYLVLLAALRHAGVDAEQVGWAQVLAVFSVVRLATALPITPAGVGIVELGLVTGLVLAGGPRPAVVAAVLVYRVLTLVVQVPLGAASYLWWRRRQARPSEEASVPVPEVAS